MTASSVALGEPLMPDAGSRSMHRATKALLFFSVGFALAVLLTSFQGVDMSERQSALSMASVMPQRPMSLGKARSSWQPASPLPAFRPTLLRQQSLKPKGLFSADAAPRTVGETKMDFQKAFPQFLPALAQSFVLEYLNDLHFYVFNPGYKYDALFALGLREIFAAGSKLAGPNNGEDLWNAICAALKLDPAKIIADADKMREYAKATAPDDILKQIGGTEKPSDPVVATAFEENNRHSQFRSVGLLRVMEYSGFKMDKDKAAEWAKAASIDNGKFIKDLQAYRKNIIKMKEGEEMLKGMAEREAKNKAEKKAKS